MVEVLRHWYVCESYGNNVGSVGALYKKNTRVDATREEGYLEVKKISEKIFEKATMQKEVSPSL